MRYFFNLPERLLSPLIPDLWCGIRVSVQLPGKKETTATPLRKWFLLFPTVSLSVTCIPVIGACHFYFWGHFGDSSPPPQLSRQPVTFSLRGFAWPKKRPPSSLTRDAAQRHPHPPLFRCWWCGHCSGSKQGRFPKLQRIAVQLRFVCCCCVPETVFASERRQSGPSWFDQTNNPADIPSKTH